MPVSTTEPPHREWRREACKTLVTQRLKLRDGLTPLATGALTLRSLIK